jgi:hypothetical protein
MQVMALELPCPSCGTVLLGLQEASWSTAAIANTSLNEVLFEDLKTINVPH